MIRPNVAGFHSDTEHLPPAVADCGKDQSLAGLPRPVSSLPDIADSGRISFGAAMRLPAVR
jgi:hypothetical protein